MKRSVRISLAAPLLLVAGLFGDPANELPAESVTAFIDVNVITMRGEDVLQGQTVIIRDGVIAALGPRDQVAVPPGAVRIDGRGKYLMPGLVDFHTHIETPVDLPMYLAAGVTTVATMGTVNPLLPSWRDSIRAGRKLGPEILVGYRVDGAAPNDPIGLHTAEEARDAVALGDALGYDFIKVYNSLDTNQFQAIMDEARRRHLPVMGHAVRSIGLQHGFALGQVAVVHAEEYIYSDFKNRIDTSLIAPAAGLTRRAGAYVIPNLSAYAVISRQWGKPAVVDTLLHQADTVFLAPYWARRWRGSDYVRRPGNLGTRTEFLSRLTRALSDSGVPLLLGTDSPGIPGMYPGLSIHEDLRLLVQAGLTPYEALSAGTRTPGEFVQRFFRQPEPAGIVALGQRADLILLAANPLNDVRHVRNPLGVMARGHWLPQDQLVRMRDDARAAGRASGQVFDSLLRMSGATRAVVAYRQLARDSSQRFIFEPEMLNDIGYRLLREKEYQSAVLVFQLNTELYPTSANAQDSYADGLVAAGDSAGAAGAYRQVLKLAPGNRDLGAGLRRYLMTTAERYLAQHPAL
jgi:imidazolonepropionase-like amidohydrolase